MRKTTAIVLAMTIFFSNMVFAQEGSNPSKVEIVFTLGNSTLNINGNNVNVETPCVENGVTLVPLRVITEAFGAQIEWIAETKTIILKYDEVILTLKIDNNIADVNGQQQQMLLAPKIVNGITMVPLRFITENFGADVTFDDVTKAIKVVKESGDGIVEDVSTALIKNEKGFVGDSYYNWSMSMNKNMKVDYSNIDGSYISFSIGTACTVDLYILPNLEKKSINEIKTEEKDITKDYTFISQTTGKTKMGIEFVRTQSKDRRDFVESIVMCYNNKIYRILTIIDAGLPASERNNYLAVPATFDFTFDKELTQDLSTVVDSNRLFKDDKFKISIKMPADLIDYSDVNKENKFIFKNYDANGNQRILISINIYSIAEGMKLEDWAEQDRNYSRNTTNEKMYAYDEVKKGNFAGYEGLYYRSSGGDISKKARISQNSFFYVGAYCYQIAISVPNGSEDIIDKIISTITVAELDKSVIGSLEMPNYNKDDLLVREVKLNEGECSIEVPVSLTKQESKIDGILFTHDKLGFTLDISNQVAPDMKKSSIYYIQGYRDYMVDEKMAYVENEIKIVNEKCSALVLKIKDEGKSYILIVGMAKTGTEIYIMRAMLPEELYGKNTIDMVNKIFKSFKTI